MPQAPGALPAIDIDRAGSVKEVGVTAQTGAAAPKNRDAIPCRPHPVRKLEARPYRPLGDEPEPGLLLRGLRRRARRARPCGPRGSGAPGTAPRPRPAGRPPRASRAGRSGGLHDPRPAPHLTVSALLEAVGPQAPPVGPGGRGMPARRAQTPRGPRALRGRPRGASRGWRQAGGGACRVPTGRAPAAPRTRRRAGRRWRPRGPWACPPRPAARRPSGPRGRSSRLRASRRRRRPGRGRSSGSARPRPPGRSPRPSAWGTRGLSCCLYSMRTEQSSHCFLSSARNGNRADSARRPCPQGRGHGPRETILSGRRLWRDAPRRRRG